MAQFVVTIYLIHSFLIEADSEEQADKLALEHRDLGLDLSGDFDSNAVTKEDFDRVNPGSGYRTLSTE
jgi:hypothetical protein